MSEQPPSPAPKHEGLWLSAFNAIKGVSFNNVLIIALLVMIAIPTYALYRVINDPIMLNKVTSNFEEKTTDKSPCTVRIYSKRGAGSTYSISTGFAFQGNDRWVVAVHMDRTPDDTEFESYCATLQLLVDFMRRPDAASPTFPGSDDPLIWKYPRE